MELTKLFLITYFAAAVGVIPPGLVNMTVAETCLRRDKRSGVMVAIGASSVVFLQAMIALLLTNYIFNNPAVKSALLRTGIVVFIIMAFYFFSAARKAKVKKVQVPSRPGFHNLAKGFLIGILNILPIPYFCALGVAFGVNVNDDDGVFKALTFMLGASIGTFTVLYGYAVGFNKVQGNTRSLTRYTNYFMAAAK